MKAMLFRRKKRRTAPQSSSSNYKVLNFEALRGQRFDGWLEKSVARVQDEAYRNLISRLYAGDVRTDFRAAAQAFRETGIDNPKTLEVGCGSGYYYEVLSYLLGYPLKYVGLDSSPAMIELASENYPRSIFVRADATRLPFRNRSFDVVLNGVSLMHIVDYEKAIAEASRVSRRWCIFHTVPIVRDRPTAVLQKNVYGGGCVVEFTFNENELIGLFVKHNLRLHSWLESIPYNLEDILHSKTVTRTYICSTDELD
jgi:ubiquinone/menaquinone biosynthesis C-methylase UbiE